MPHCLVRLRLCVCVGIQGSSARIQPKLIKDKMMSLLISAHITQNLLLCAGRANRDGIMKIWLTEFKAADAKTGEMKTWGGENVTAPSWELAQQWCYDNRGYLKVIGELVAEIPCKEGTYEPDFDNMIDYENQQLN